VDIGSLLLILAISLLAGFVVSRPFFAESSDKSTDEEITELLAGKELKLSNLMSEKERIFTTLQELETAHALKKIPDEEFPKQRVVLVHAAAKTLRDIDELEVEIKSILKETSVQKKGASLAANAGIPNEVLEELIAARRRSRSEKSAGFCPHCGKVIQSSDVFCPACGSRVSAS